MGVFWLILLVLKEIWSKALVDLLGLKGNKVGEDWTPVLWGGEGAALGCTSVLCRGKGEGKKRKGANHQ